MNLRVAFTYMILALCLMSCAPVQWDMRVSKNADLVWPPPPNPAKAQYLGEITSFVPTGKSLATVIFGKSTKDGRIMKPVSLAVASDGRIAIADLQAIGVHLYIPGSQSYRLINRTSKHKLISPVSVAFDDNLTLFVSDSNLRKVFMYDPNGDYIGEITGPGGAKKFSRPTGLAYVAQNDSLYVVDTLANEVDVFDHTGKFKFNFGRRGIGDGEFNMPTHIAANASHLLVNDAMNFRVQTFAQTGRFLDKFGHHGDGSGDFAMAKGVAIDRWGVVYVAETLFDVVQLFDMSGEYLMSIGGKGTAPGQFWMPSGLFIDRYNKLYVCDTYNKRVQLFQLLHIGTGGGQ